MRELRAMQAVDNNIHFIYGLDADLILLSVLNCATYHPTESFFLYREDMKDGEICYDDNKKEQLTIFSIDILMKYIAERRPSVLNLQDTWRSWMIDYVFIMSLLGNDFLPSYVTLSFKDDGHATIMRLLNNLWDKGERLVETWSHYKKDIKYEKGGESWKIIWARLAEEGDEVRYNKLVEKKKTMMQKRAGRGEQVCSVVETGVYNSKEELMADWKDRIYVQFSGVNGSSRLIQRKLVEWYKTGLNWVLQYYFGYVVDLDWYYPAYITPFCDDCNYYWDKVKISAGTGAAKMGLIPSMSEQLALVLPGKDMGLIPEPSLRGFNKSMWFLESDVKYHEFMKWAEWERIPKIPSPLLNDLRIWNRDY
jgi:5'-3' exonuclease